MCHYFPIFSFFSECEYAYLYCCSSTNTSVLAVELISAANNVNVSITFFSSTTFLFDIVIIE